MNQLPNFSLTTVLLVCQTGQLLKSFSLFPLLDSISLDLRQNLDHTQGHADDPGETLYRFTQLVPH